MAFILHDEGEEWLLKVGFSEEESVPANFYLGLCNDTLVKTDGLSDIANEPSGDGYSRQDIASDNVGCVVSVDGVYHKVTFLEQNFAASGGDWGSINTWFLATTNDDSGVLIASGPIDPARTIADGDDIDVESYIRLKYSTE